MTNFYYSPITRIAFGCKSIDSIGKEVVHLGGKHVLLVTDNGVAEAGHVDRVVSNLESCQIRVAIFDGVSENPTTNDVRNCLKLARERPIDLIIGLGGGSSLDTAKGCNFLLTNGGNMQDYWGMGKAKNSMLPMIAIPTTAGTGSETQSFALISDEITHRKMACGDPKATPKIAILDPEVTLSQPKNVALCTGIDAIAHAVESFVSKNRNPISSMFAKEAFALTQSSFPSIVKDPANIEARSKMLLGASYAGIAIENSMLGAAHAAANPLTAHYGVVHGAAVGVLLPYVMKFNCFDSSVKSLYADLATCSGLQSTGKTEDSADALVDSIQSLIDLAGFRELLKSYNIKNNDAPLLAKAATEQWTANFNPKPIRESDFVELYEKILEC